VSSRLGNHGKVLQILMLSNIYKPVSTGSTNQIAGLAKEVSNHGHQVHIITSMIEENLPYQEFQDGISISRLKSIRLPRTKLAMNFAWLNWLTTPANYRKASQYATENKIDLIHVHNHMFDALLLGILVSRKNKIPICLTLHTIMQHNQKFYNVILATIDKLVLKVLVSNWINIVIAPDYNMVKYAEKKLGVKSLELIPYGVDEPLEVTTTEIDSFIRNNSLMGRKVVISVGHVNHLRNRLDLVQAIAHVAKYEPSILLVVIGDIADKRAPELVSKLKINVNVVFTGIGTKEEISLWRRVALFEAQWLQQAPDGSNSFGVASMEGMMAGNTVLSVANIDTFGPGTLKNFSNVIAIQPNSGIKLADLILELIKSPSVLASIGEQAEIYARENFSWSENAEKHIELYSRLKS
jgi:glycosyltransferase involved in cell wall biosynthesis